jgi:uncharacterized protein YciW
MGERVETRYSAKLRKLETRILDGPGALDPSVRRALADGDSPGDGLADKYVEKIRTNAYKIVDRTLEELKAAGWTEDQIFELSICTAFGAARYRLDAGLRAIDQARSDAEQTSPAPLGPGQRSE